MTVIESASKTQILLYVELFDCFFALTCVAHLRTEYLHSSVPAVASCCLQTVICSEGRDVMLIVKPFFRKQSDKVVTFSSAGPTFCL